MPSYSRICVIFLDYPLASNILVSCSKLFEFLENYFYVCTFFDLDRVIIGIKKACPSLKMADLPA
jgi:hypothetical protein